MGDTTAYANVGMATAATELEATQTRLKDAIAKGLSAEERTRQLEQMLKDEEKDLEAVMKEVAGARDQQYSSSTQAATLKAKVALGEQEVQVVVASIRNANSRLQTVENEISQQGKVLYQQDFQVTALERQVQKLEGKR
jgi:phage shock protein A